MSFDWDSGTLHKSIWDPMEQVVWRSDGEDVWYLENFVRYLVWRDIPIPSLRFVPISCRECFNNCIYPIESTSRHSRVANLVVWWLELLLLSEGQNHSMNSCWPIQLIALIREFRQLQIWFHSHLLLLRCPLKDIRCSSLWLYCSVTLRIHTPW